MRSRISSTAAPHSTTTFPLQLTLLAGLVAALGLPTAASAHSPPQNPPDTTPQPIVVTGALPKNSAKAAQADGANGIGAPNQRIDESDPIEGELESQVFETGQQARRSVLSESPVDILSARELHSTGSTELATVLARLLPLFNFPRPSGAGAGDAVRPLQLHGLSPDQTVVLVNGKRRHSSAVLNLDVNAQGRGAAAVDLNAIPLAAVDHVEVLRDGAAALYGSDAIAGVVNVVLKQDAAGGAVEAGFGEYQKRDGKQNSVSASAGVALGQDGWLRLGAEMAKLDATNRADPDLRNAADPRYGQVNQRYGDPDSRPRSLFANSAYRINDRLEWYAFASYGERKTSAAAAWQPAYNDATTAPLPARYPQGYLPLQNSSSTDQSVVSGLRGQAGGWNWDASLNYGANKFSLDVDDTANTSLGDASPSHFYAGQLKNSATLGNLDISRDFAVAWFRGPLTLATGLELRHDQYQIGAGDSGSYSDTAAAGYIGFRPTDAGSHSRNSAALYLNLEAEISQQLSATLAARHERHDGFGSNTSGTASARYEFNNAFSLRGTASTGARAPSLAQQFFSGEAGDVAWYRGVTIPLFSPVLPVTNVVAQALGAQPLRPEKAHKISLGLQFQPAPAFSASVDAYLVNISDRIMLSSFVILPRELVATPAAQDIRGGAVRFFSNAADTRTSGVDLSGTYRMVPAPQQRLEFTLAYNHNQTSVRRLAATPAVLQAQDSVLVDRRTLLNLTAATPKDKLGVSSDYTVGNWSGHALLTRYGKFTVAEYDAALDQAVGAQWVLDLAGSVRLGQNWKLSAGIDNANNRYPDRATAISQFNNNGAAPYSAFSPNGFNGRYYYARAAYAW